MCLASQISPYLTTFLRISAKTHEFLACCAVGVPADTSTVVGISTIYGIHAVMGLPSAVDVCDARIVCIAVANVLVVSSCCYS